MKLLAHLFCITLLPAVAYAQTLVVQGFTDAKALVWMGSEWVVAGESQIWRVDVHAQEVSSWNVVRSAQWRALAVDGVLLYAADTRQDRILAINRAGELVVVRDEVRATALAVDRTGALFYLDEEGVLHVMSSSRHDIPALRVSRRFAPETTLTFDGHELLLLEPNALWVRSPVGELRQEPLPRTPVRHLAARGDVRWYLGAGWVAVAHPGGVAYIDVPEQAVKIFPGTSLDFFLLTPDALWHWPAPVSSR